MPRPMETRTGSLVMSTSPASGNDGFEVAAPRDQRANLGGLVDDCAGGGSSVEGLNAPGRNVRTAPPEMSHARAR